jgi:anti-sigma factor RsiW
MNRIDQHNYETYFLQYVDGELSAADRKAVDNFIEANPDLAFELDQLMDARLVPEPIAFPDKDSLYRHSASDSRIGMNNYETYLLLAVDKEISASDEQLLESFLAQHPEKREEFALLLQTRLPDEPMVFADKASLYRKDRKAPVIFPQWQRWAAAAVMAGLAFSVWMLAPDSQISSRNKAVTATPLTVTPSQETAEAGRAAMVNTKPADEKPAASLAAETKPVADAQKTESLAANTVQDPPVAVTVQPTETTDIPTVTANNRDTKADPVTAAAVQGSFETKVSRTTQVSGNNPVAENIEPQASDVKQVVYRELDTDTHDDDRTLLLGSLEINKDKLRGLFRKAASLLHSKNKQDADRSDEDSSPKKARSLK